jgi:hypothetical protein
MATAFCDPASWWCLQIVSAAVKGATVHLQQHRHRCAIHCKQHSGKCLLKHCLSTKHTTGMTPQPHLLGKAQLVRLWRLQLDKRPPPYIQPCSPSTVLSYAALHRPLSQQQA